MSCPTDNELAELVDGSLRESRSAEVERHLDGCDACTLLVAELAWVVGAGVVAPPGYRFTKQLAPNVFEAIGSAGPAIVELGAVAPEIASVKHPAVATIFDVGDDFIAYERVATSLRAWSDGRSPVQRLAAWTAVLRGLAAIHRAGAVHGAISPDHVFVDGDRVLIAAFARPLSRTSGYLAAEILEGNPATAASDQLAACIALYEALAGRKPFVGATPGALVVTMASPPPLLATIDRGRARSIARGLAFDPADRWRDMDSLVAALERPSSDRRPWVFAAIAAAAIVAIALIAN
jgi:hypothetical protein